MLQRTLLRLYTRGLLPGGKRLLRRRVWTVEGGAGAGLKLRFPQNLDYVSGSSEKPVQDAMAEHVKRDSVFYDVGANVGFFSLLAARLVGPGGRVHSFEPVSENAASVRENARLSGLSNVTVHEVAVGRAGGSQELLLTAWDGGATLSTSVVKPPNPSGRRVVRLVALDDYIKAERLPAPHFVKIDVEGAELDVIEGMARTIAESRPALLYEVDDGDRERFDRRWTELDDRVTALGYRVMRLGQSYPNRNWFVGHSLARPAT
jgi:FkbM family methyltransferase